LPTYSFIEPNHHPPLQFVDDAAGEVAPGLSSSQHPENNLISAARYDAFTENGSTDFRRAETLIAEVYEALRSNRELFERSLLLITYDEHGGFYDHVPPTAVVPNPGTQQHWQVRLLHKFWRPNAARFGFTRLGIRVPTLVISPYVRRGDVDQSVYDHSSVPATLRALFIPDALPLTQRDAHANTFHHILSLPTPRRGALPDLSEYDRAHSVAATSASVEQRSGVVPSPGGATPASYDPYIAQAKHVFRKLSRLREDEATTRLSARTPRDRATEIADRFGAAAERHRANIRSTQPRSD
jgi:phospholipase C